MDYGLPFQLWIIESLSIMDYGLLFQLWIMVYYSNYGLWFAIPIMDYRESLYKYNTYRTESKISNERFCFDPLPYQTKDFVSTTFHTKRKILFRPPSIPNE